MGDGNNAFVCIRILFANYLCTKKRGQQNEKTINRQGVRTRSKKNKRRFDGQSLLCLKREHCSISDYCNRIVLCIPAQIEEKICVVPVQESSFQALLLAALAKRNDSMARSH